MLYFLPLTTEKTSTIGNYVYLADLDDEGLIRHVGSHLACFYAGNWLLGNDENTFDPLLLETEPFFGQVANLQIMIPSSTMHYS